jgi:hypothetical protein
MSKDPYYTNDNPLKMIIKETLTGWTIEPHPSVMAEMTRRRDNDLNLVAIDQAWNGRKKPGAPAGPEWRLDPDHKLFVVREGEVIEFECTRVLQFSAFVDTDPQVNPFPGAPNILFEGWTGPKLTTPGRTIRGKVPKTVAGGVGPGDQRFFKASSWIIDGGISRADPDGYCDR